MKITYCNNQSGKISRILLMVAALLVVTIIVVYLVARLTAIKNKNSQNSDSGNSSTSNHEPAKPTYEATLGDIRFLLESSEDLGNDLRAKFSYEKDLKTTERFIKVTVAAQNKGKNNTRQNSWDLGNIVDAEGRNFIADNRVYDYLPQPDLCGAILKPEFEPTPCVKIYEVSRESANLKIEVKVSEPKRQSSLIDLKLNQ